MSAWVGDSRCVMFTVGADPPVSKLSNSLMIPGSKRQSGLEHFATDEGVLAIQSLTIDHDPRDIGERHRILSTGGLVNATSKRVNSRDCQDEDKDSGLAMSRALGDLCLHSFGVIHS